MNKNFIAELAVVGAVGYGLAKVTQAIPALNENKTLTRTLLYTLGYYIATRRPEGGYKLLGDGSGT
jgi:hypothetical protein